MLDVIIVFSPRKEPEIRNELLSPKKETARVASPRPFISPRKVVVSPVKSPSKVCFPWLNN